MAGDTPPEKSWCQNQTFKVEEDFMQLNVGEGNSRELEGKKMCCGWNRKVICPATRL